MNVSRRMTGIAIGLACVALAGAAVAGDEPRFVVRAGVAMAETSGAALGQDGGGNPQLWEAGGESGFDVGFEWFATDRIGLEVQLASSEYELELETASAESEVGDIESQSIHVGLNYHILRTKRIDFGAGFHLGIIGYDELEFEPPLGGAPPAVSLETDYAMGLQSSVDIHIGKRWGVYGGIRYQETSATVDSVVTPALGVPVTIPVDPMTVRVGGIFRFGR